MDGLPARRCSRRSLVGTVAVGGGAPIVVQSMTNTDTADIAATVAQVAALARAGSEIVRVTVNTAEAAAAVPHIRDQLAAKGVDVPLVGDFHFNGHRLLTQHPACAEALAKLRINPGNVGHGSKRDEQFATLIEFACRYKKPVRIGVNWGSLDPALLARMMDENARSASPDDVQIVTRRSPQWEDLTAIWIRRYYPWLHFSRIACIGAAGDKGRAFPDTMPDAAIDDSMSAMREYLAVGVRHLVVGCAPGAPDQLGEFTAMFRELLPELRIFQSQPLVLDIEVADLVHGLLDVPCRDPEPAEDPGALRPGTEGLGSPPLPSHPAGDDDGDHQHDGRDGDDLLFLPELFERNGHGLRPLHVAHRTPPARA